MQVPLGHFWHSKAILASTFGKRLEQKKVKIICLLIMSFSIILNLTACSNNHPSSSGEKKMMSSNLVKEIKTFRKTNRKANIEITMLIENYIPKGISKQEAIVFLEDNGFKVHLTPKKGAKPEYIVGQINNRGDLLGFYDEYRIVLDVEGEKVTKSWGAIFYHAL